MTIVEDEEGNVARLTISNLEDSPVDPIIPENTIMAIKQPSWSKLVEGGYHIRIDHPSDVVFLNPSDDLIPDAWKTDEGVKDVSRNQDWRKEGDMMFLKKKFRKALEW